MRAHHDPAPDCSSETGSHPSPCKPVGCHSDIKPEPGRAVAKRHRPSKGIGNIVSNKQQAEPLCCQVRRYRLPEALEFGLFVGSQQCRRFFPIISAPRANPSRNSDAVHVSEACAAYSGSRPRLRPPDLRIRATLQLRQRLHYVLIDDQAVEQPLGSGT